MLIHYLFNITEIGSPEQPTVPLLTAGAGSHIFFLTASQTIIGNSPELTLTANFPIIIEQFEVKNFDQTLHPFFSTPFGTNTNFSTLSKKKYFL